MGLLSRRSLPYRVATERRAVVLCAGGSTRMGHPKGLLPVDGVPLLRAHVDAFVAAGLPVTVVLGAAVEAHVQTLPEGVQIIFNPRWSCTEMWESAHLALRDAGIVLLVPVDVPPAAPATIAALLAATGPAIPTWGGRPGHPVRLEPPHPAARLDERLRGAREIPVADPDCVLNLNRPAEWAAWLASRRA